MKILILKFRNIGDVLLAVPLLSNLKKYYPNSQIDVSVNKETESMVSLNPNINKIIPYDRNKIKSLGFIRRAIEEVIFLYSFKKGNYDMIINLTEGDRGAQIAWLSGAKIRVGYQNQNWLFRNAFNFHLPKQNLIHTVEQSLNPLRVLDIPIVDKKVKIFWPKEDDKFIDNLSFIGQKFIHIHPVSRWMFKCISDSTMAKIIDYCEVELNIKAVITAAPVKAELDRVNNILSFCKSAPVNLSGKLTLKQTAALNKKAKMFIGVDTAVMHISAANDTPVLAFFGPTGINNWGPWDNSKMKSSYLQRNGIQTMGMHKVIAERRSCQPCGSDGCNGTKISDCLMNLDITMIKNSIFEMINEKSN